MSDPAALSASAVEGFLEGPGLHQDIGSAGRTLIGYDPREQLGAVRCPVLVLWGARDRLVPLTDGYEYARRLRAPIRVIADCSHLLIGERRGRHVLYRLHDEHVASLLDEAVFHMQHLDLGAAA